MFFSIWLLVTVVSLVANNHNNNVWMFSIEVNRFKTPFFELGLSNRHWHNDEGQCIWTFTMGFFLFNIVFDFFNFETEEDGD